MHAGKRKLHVIYEARKTPCLLIVVKRHRNRAGHELAALQTQARRGALVRARCLLRRSGCGRLERIPATPV